MILPRAGVLNWWVTTLKNVLQACSEGKTMISPNGTMQPAIKLELYG